MRTKTIVLLALLAIVAASAAIFLFGPLKRYESKALGIKFSYPRNYFVEEKNLSDGVRAIILTEDTEENRLVREGKSPGRDGPTAIMIVVHAHPVSTSTIDWMKQDPSSNYHLAVDNFERRDFRGMDSILYVTDGLYFGDNIVIEINGNIIHMSVTYLTQEDSIRDDFKRVIDTMELH